MKNNNSERVGASVGIKNDAGESPLQMALNAGLEEGVALKLVEKAGKEALEMRDSKGDSSLHLAVRCGLKDAAIKLVEQLGEECRSESWEAAVRVNLYIARCVNRR